MSSIDKKSRHELERGSSSEHSTDTSFLMLDSDHKMDSSHEYASPQELQNQIKQRNDTLDGKKKRNLLYEPLTLPVRNKTHSDNINNTSYQQHHHHERLYRFTLVVIVLFSLAAFLLSLLTSFGYINARTCLCDREIESAVPLNGGKDKLEWKHFLELKKNLTELTTKVIPEMLAKIKKLESVNTTHIGKQGPPGPRGPAGIEGPPGPGDLSKCQYKTDAISSAYKFADETYKEKINTRFIRATKGFIILGASCTTMGGSQASLFQKNTLGTPTYSCKCAGVTNNVAFQYPSLLCRIHWWECPLIS